MLQAFFAPNYLRSSGRGCQYSKPPASWAKFHSFVDDAMPQMQKLPGMEEKPKCAKNANFLQNVTQGATKEGWYTTWAGRRWVGGGGPPRGASILFRVQAAATHTGALTSTGA